MTSELSRSQQRNLSDCIQKISDIIAEASEKPHEPSVEDIALRKSRYSTSSRALLISVHSGYACSHCFGCEMCCADWRRETRRDSIRRRSRLISRGVEGWILTKIWTNCVYLQLSMSVRSAEQETSNSGIFVKRS